MRSITKGDPPPSWGQLFKYCDQLLSPLGRLLHLKIVVVVVLLSPLGRFLHPKIVVVVVVVVVVVAGAGGGRKVLKKWIGLSWPRSA